LFPEVENPGEIGLIFWVGSFAPSDKLYGHETIIRESGDMEWPKQTASGSARKKKDD
jgi:hypothetical protein